MNSHCCRYLRNNGPYDSEFLHPASGKLPSLQGPRIIWLLYFFKVLNNLYSTYLLDISQFPPQQCRFTFVCNSLMSKHLLLSSFSFLYTPLSSLSSDAPPTQFWGLPRWYNGKESPAVQEAEEMRVRSLGWGRSPREGNGNLLQYSWLENLMNRGAWRATVHVVQKSRTRLSNSTTTPLQFWGLPPSSFPRFH